MSSPPLATRLVAGAPPRSRLRSALALLGMLAVAASAWWVTFAGRLDANGGVEVPAETLRAFLAVLIAGRLAGNALEAAFYRAWWTSAGARFRYGVAWLGITGLSLLDAWAMTLQDLARGPAIDWAPALAVLAGPAALSPAEAPATAAAAALSGVGLLAALRVAGTAWLQRRETGAPFHHGLGLTVAAWLAMRLLAWWTFDLTRGMSPS
jgi:hypothetical protein